MPLWVLLLSSSPLLSPLISITLRSWAQQTHAQLRYCCSAIAVATIALSATRAAAFPGFESGGSFDFKGTAEGLSETDNGESGDKSFSNTDTTTVGGFSACAAKSWAGAAAGSKDSYASASKASSSQCSAPVLAMGTFHCIVA